LEAAKREFREETGHEVDGEFTYLGEVRLASGKIVHAWALEKDLGFVGFQTLGVQEKAEDLKL
jgi:predicted NUDIX family NTP pyrophosphohydrolase